ncbi:MAG TPA: CHASE domain-containing protein, partial [Actinoplanes sp.]|nr:CHASE domain-containing protein [Actinoplanes sp.]
MIRLRRWRPTRTGLLFARLTAVAGMLATLGVGAVVAENRQSASAAALDRRVSEMTRAITAETGRYVDAITTVTAAAGAVPQLTATAFSQITAPIAGMRLAGATSLSYLVPATDSTVADVQRRWRARGATDLVLQPEAGKPEHIFSIFNTALDGAPRTPGTDVTASPVPTAALQLARSTAQVAISDPFLLARDRDLAPGRRQQSFILASPVFGPLDAAGNRPFRGWITMGLR